MAERAVVEAAMIFHPCGMGGVGAQVASGDVMVLATDHLPEPREVALDLVRRNAVVAVGERMIDALHVEIEWQRVPMRRLVSDDLAALIATTLRAISTPVWLLLGDECQSAAACAREARSRRGACRFGSEARRRSLRSSLRFAGRM